MGSSTASNRGPIAFLEREAGEACVSRDCYSNCRTCEGLVKQEVPFV